MARSFPSSTGWIHLPANPAPLPALHCLCSKYHPALPAAREPPQQRCSGSSFSLGRKEGLCRRNVGSLVVELGPFLLLTQKPKMHQAGVSCMKASHTQEKGGLELLCPNSHNILLNRKKGSAEIISDLIFAQQEGVHGLFWHPQGA